MGKLWLIALITTVVGIASFWLWRQLDDDATLGRLPRRHEPDYYLIEMVRRTMNREGGLQSVLTAEQVFHFPDDDTTELAHPHMEIYNGGENPWQVVAERGIVKSDNEVIVLQGRVEIWRVDSQGRREFEILTSELRVFPKVQYAETDNAATIKGPSTVTKTRGSRANFEHNRLELLNQVRSRHEKRPAL
ncbi:MAG: LPS export ABC transporter periplasmic protein LptC [Gammaproteobacteria bacterium]